MKKRLIQHCLIFESFLDSNNWDAIKEVKSEKWQKTAKNLNNQL